MPSDTLPYAVTRDGLLLSVRVQPKSSGNRLLGLHDGALKLALTAPPVDNRANRAASEFLAKLLGVPKSAVILKSGAQSRAKTFLITASAPLLLADRLADLISQVGK